MKPCKTLLAVLIVAAIAAMPASVAAAPPPTLSFQGYLTGTGGTPVNGNVQMVFKLYNVASGGSALWTETQPVVAVASGLYGVVLGSVTPINLPFDTQYFLGVTVGADAEMLPREQITSVGYAFRALSVESGAFSGNISLPNSSAANGSVNLGGQSFLHNYGGFNTFLGASSGNYTLTGIDLTGVGYNALKSNTDGSDNTAVGFNALTANTSGPGNTAVGARALSANDLGVSNTAVGVDALRFNVTSQFNTAVGAGALNNYVGTGTNGRSTAVGRQALGVNTTGINNVAVGDRALGTNVFGYGNIAIGTDAGFASTGYNNIYIGNIGVASELSTIRVGASGSQSRAFIFGIRGAQTATDGTPVFIDSSGQLGTSNGTSRTYLGAGAGNPAASAAFLVAIGNDALKVNTSGDSNTAVGGFALAANVGGHSNTAVGRSALATSFDVNAVRNTAIGRDALAFSTAGAGNTAAGAYSLGANTSGSDNVAIGLDALRNNFVGSTNTAVGTHTLYISTGSNNIAIGNNAGQALTTGNNNIAIGHSGFAAESNTIRLGTSAAGVRAFVAGIRGTTTGVADAIAVLVDSSGQLGTTSSSMHVKDAIADMGDASSALMRLRPVTFTYKEYGPESRLQYGLIAEEVEQVYPGLVAKRADGSAETVMYQFLPPMLLNEVQRQQRTIERQAVEIAELRRAVAELAARR